MHNESHSDQHEINHYHLTYYFEVAVECVNSLAGVLVLIAVCLAGINLFIVAVNSMTGSDYLLIDPLRATRKATILRIRLMLGEQTALALALLVAADVLDTVMKPSHAFEMNDVIKMGFLTVLRTGVAYFLAREIKELEMGGGHSSHVSMDNLVDSDSMYRRRGQHRRSGNNLTLVRSNSSKMRIQGKEKESDRTTNSNNSINAGDFEFSYDECVDEADDDYEEKYYIEDERPPSLRFRGRPGSSNKLKSCNSDTSRHRKSGSSKNKSSTSQQSVVHEE
eukprot:gene35712-46328_t